MPALRKFEKGAQAPSMKNDIRVRLIIRPSGTKGGSKKIRVMCNNVKAKPKMRKRIMILSDAGGLLIRDMNKKWFDYESCNIFGCCRQ